jgi:thiamine biosynthesis protein ThiI
MYDHAVLHYGEIGTKGDNRRRFEERLLVGVARALRPYVPKGAERRARPRRSPGRIVFALDAIPPGSRDLAIAAVARQPGVAWISPAVKCEPDLASIAAVAVALARRRTGSFKIRANRTDKSLPFDSHRIHCEVGAAVNAATGRAVRMDAPDDVYRIEVDRRAAWVHDAKIPGAGGLPVGSAGKVVALLSGGIDSPVAAYRMMLRGCEVMGLHLWNRSYSGDGVRDKVLALGQALAQHQGRFRLVLVPFDGIQRAIVAASPDDVRMLLYRRAMLRVAAEVRRAGRHDAVVLGDSVSQVASQTMRNLAAVYDAGEGLLLSPLAGSCKSETIGIAERIGTYGISIGPGADCCGLLVAKHPRTACTSGELRGIEAGYDLPALVAEALAGRETHDLAARA